MIGGTVRRSNTWHPVMIVDSFFYFTTVKTCVESPHKCITRLVKLKLTIKNIISLNVFTQKIKLL